MPRFRVARHGALLGPMCVLLLALATAPSAGAATVAAQSPARFAHAIFAAHGPSARRAAIGSVMRALHIGIYDARGRAIYRGAERGQQSLWVYSAELGSLGNGLVRQENRSFNDLAALLTGAGVGPGGAPATGAELDSAVVRGLQRLRGEPTDPASQLGLIVRSLGLARRVDLARPTDPAAKTLDALQTYLILAEILGPFERRGAHASNASDGGASRASLCNNDFTGTTGSSVTVGKWIVGWTSKASKVTVALLVPDILHGIAMGLSINLAVVPTDTTTTWGTTGAWSGKVITFKVHAEMLDDYGDLGDCAASLGYTIPPKGPIQGMTIDWSSAIGTFLLGKLGTITCPPKACAQTDDKGDATLTFTPYDDDFADLGTLQTDTGSLAPAGTINFKQGNFLGSVAELVGMRREVEIPWTVTHHQATGFRFDATIAGVVWGSADTANYEYHFSVCGSRAFAPLISRNAPDPLPSTPEWIAITGEHHTSYLPNVRPGLSGSEPTDAIGSLGDVPFTRGQITSRAVANQVRDGDESGFEFDHTIDVQLVENPARAILTAHFDSNHHIGDFTTSVPVTEFAC